MTVYLVSSGSYSDYQIDGVFSTRELADSFCAELKKAQSDEPVIEEWALDERAGEVYRPTHQCRIDLRTGTFTDEWENGEIGKATDRVPKQLGGYNPRDHVTTRSFVSAEHARKLAVEARQEWLRKDAMNPHLKTAEEMIAARKQNA